MIVFLTRYELDDSHPVHIGPPPEFMQRARLVVVIENDGSLTILKDAHGPIGRYRSEILPFLLASRFPTDLPAGAVDTRDSTIARAMAGGVIDPSLLPDGLRDLYTHLQESDRQASGETGSDQA